jgi:Histidine kinase
MNVIPAEPLTTAPATENAGRIFQGKRESMLGAATTWPQLGILTAFWVYVTLSNVLYARSMSATLDPVGAEHFFAAWQARVLQHLFLYPVLILCVRTSFRIGWWPAWRAWPIQISLALLFAALAMPVMVASESLIGDDPGHHGMSSDTSWSMSAILHNPKFPIWVASTTSFLLAYGFGLALLIGYALVQRFRDSELRVAALGRAWSSARLSALRMQLSPHTLFNLLHTIRGQIVWDPPAAQSMIVQLADLLRRLLTAGEREFSELSCELQFARLYLELQQTRFADRLAIVLPDIETLPSAWVPSLILQPLIENAVVHGLARHDGAVEIRIEAATSADQLVLRVVNSIAPDCVAAPDGIGSRNVRERLALHFGDRASFAAGPNQRTEWVAEVRLPWLRDRPQTRAGGD